MQQAVSKPPLGLFRGQWQLLRCKMVARLCVTYRVLREVVWQLQLHFSLAPSCLYSFLMLLRLLVCIAMATALTMPLQSSPKAVLNLRKPGSPGIAFLEHGKHEAWSERHQFVNPPVFNVCFLAPHQHSPANRSIFNLSPNLFSQHQHRTPPLSSSHPKLPREDPQSTPRHPPLLQRLRRRQQDHLGQYRLQSDSSPNGPRCAEA